MEKTLATLPELEAEAAQFVRSLRPQEHAATLVTLSGNLGAGKTAFTKAAAAALGVEETITSPTFVLEKMYLLPQNENGHLSFFKRLIHIDAYRLENGAALAPLGFDELMQFPENLIVLEWPEKVADALPQAAAAIHLEAREDGARTLTYA